MRGKRERLGPGLLKTPLRADHTSKPLVYVTVVLPIIAGFSLLAISPSRASILNSPLQLRADAMAPSMAGEADHTSDTFMRTERATVTLAASPETLSGYFASMNGSAIGYRLLGELLVDDKDPTTEDPNKALDPEAASVIEAALNQATFDTMSPVLRRTNVLARCQNTEMGDAGLIASPIQRIMVSLRNVEHEFRFLGGLANVAEVNFPSSAISAITSEDFKTTWSNS